MGRRKIPKSLWDPLPKALLKNRRSDGTRMLPEQRKIRFPEIAGWFDPHEISSDHEPPPGVRAAAEEIFGEDIKWEGERKARGRSTRFPPDVHKKGWLKIALHPWFKRWVLFEWCIDHRDGKMYWKPMYVCMEPGRTGYLPKDLDHPDGRYDDLRSKMGDYRVPTKEDFEEVKIVADFRRNPTNHEVVMKFYAIQERENIAAEKRMQDFERDFQDHYSDLRCQIANQIFGGMQGLPFVPQTSLEQLAKESRDEAVASGRRIETEKKGYKIIERRRLAQDDLPNHDVPRRELTPAGRFVTIEGALPEKTGVTLDEVVEKAPPTPYEERLATVRREALEKVG